MARTAVVLGSTRPGRLSTLVAGRLVPVLAQDHEVEIVDLAEVDLPFFDEETSPKAVPGVREHTLAWARLVDSFDAFVLVTPEYNAAYPAVLKNALDFLSAEWVGKPVAVVAYGWHGGARVAAALRPVLANLGMREVDGVGLQFGEHVADGAWSTDAAVLERVDTEFAALSGRLHAAVRAATATAAA